MVRDLQRGLIGFILVWALFGVACSGVTSPTPPTAAHGLLDLSKWDFQKHGTVTLRGQWFFEWESFSRPVPADFLPPQRPTVAEVPSNWLQSPYTDPDLTESRVQGYATYYLRVQLPPNLGTESFSLQTNLAQSAATWEVYTLDTGLPLTTLSIGKPGIDADTSTPTTGSGHAALAASNENAILVVAHISSYSHARPGMVNAPAIGLRKNIRASDLGTNMASAFIIGICLVIGLYHFIIAFQQRSDRGSLYFSALCFAMALREVTTANLLPNLNITDSAYYVTLLKLEYISIPLLITSASAFLSSMLPNARFKLFVSTASYIPSVVLIVFALVSDTLTLSSYLWVFRAQLIVLTTGGLCYLVYRAARDGGPAIWILAAFGLLAGGAINDLLHNVHIVTTMYLTPYTFMAFILLQSAVISDRMAKAFKEAGALTKRNIEQAQEFGNEVSRRAQVEKELHVELNTKVGLIANAIHHLNNPLNHIQGSLYLAQNEELQLQTFINSLLPDDEADPMVAAARGQVEGHFNTIHTSSAAIQNALERATNSVMMLRALSQLDGVSYNHSNVDEVWRVLIQRSSLPLDSINHHGLVAHARTTVIGHPALYAHAMELLFDYLWDTVSAPNKLQVTLSLARDNQSDFHLIEVNYDSDHPEAQEASGDLRDQIACILRPYKCSLTIAPAQATLSLRAKQIMDSDAN